MQYKLNCQLCGNEFTSKRNYAMYCHPCRYVAQLKRNEINKTKRGYKNKKKSSDNITSINIAARQAGLSYGQYVAQMYAMRCK